MFRWYRELTSREKRTFWACFGQFGLDGMDVQIYSFVIPTLISLWKLTPADAGLLATCTLLFSAVAYLLMVIAAVALPETRGKEFTRDRLTANS
jgi:MFS family permease